MDTRFVSDNSSPVARILRSSRALPIASFLLLSGAVFAGSGGSLRKPSETPLLSFFDGGVVFDVEERMRAEARNNTRDFNDASKDDNDDSWLINRFRLGVALRPASWLKLYGQMQDTREWDSDRPNVPGVRGTEGGDEFDLRLGYVEIGDLRAFPLSLTIGRQALSYGDNRLVADARWNNFGRTFDAIKLRYQAGGLTVDAFAARPVQIKEHVFDDSDSADDFFGFHLTTDAIRFQPTDVYFFYRDKADNQPDLDPVNKLDPRGSSTGMAQRIGTIGSRWKSAKGLRGWDYTVEAAFQFGTVWMGDRTAAELEQRAWAGHVSGGYSWEGIPWKPRLGAAYNYASGDRDPADGRSQSFQTLFPSPHAKFGDMDDFAWRNLHHMRVPITLHPTDSIEFELAYNATWLADTRDYWYRSGTAPLRTLTLAGKDVRTIGADRFAGQELDFIVRWKASAWLNVDAGYSHFFAGDYLRDTGPADDADFGYVQAQLLF